MDPRNREHAEIIVDQAVDVQESDDVVLRLPPAAEDLGVALHEKIGEVGANPVSIALNERFSRAYLRAGEEFETPEHKLALIEECDVFIAVRGNSNVTETSDVDPETAAAAKAANQPILSERLSKRWCLTQYPTRAHAQLAEMSTEAYENFVWDAILKDWGAVEEHQEQMVEILDPADEVRIVSGDRTDVTMSVDGNHTINDCGNENLPAGEVFTAPVRESLDGEILFDKPLYHQGREVLDAYLEFENGKVVDHSAAKNEEVLTGILNTDENARYMGELGIGMNRDIDRFTYNMLFDEKMGDTVHMALGRAYEDTVGEDNERNDSAVHVDMIVDMSENSRIEVDGEVVQEDGTFVFEDEQP